MNFNWIDAATPQGRERLQELMDKGKPIAMREDDSFGGKRIIEGIKIDRTYYVGKRGVPSSIWAKWDLSGVEFLDPEPRQPEPHKDEIKCPNSLLSLADAIVEAIYKARNTEDEEWGKISHPLLLELWLDAIDDAWNRRDPDQPNEIAAIKAENERMRNALLEIEADARAKLAANLPLNSNETLHSVKHGLGQMFVNSKSGDIGAAIDAIARTFKKPEPELKPLEWRFYNLSNSYVSQHCPLTNQFIAQKANNGVWGLNACCNDTDTTFPTFEALAAHVEALRHEALKKLLK